MGVFFDVPPYPVIDKAPGFWKTGGASSLELRSALHNICLPGLARMSSNKCLPAVSHFSIQDWGIAAGSTAACYPFGWWAGK